MRACDIYQLGVSLLPTVLRRSRFVAIVSVLLGGVGMLQTQGHRYGSEMRYRLGKNAQVCKLRMLLNDKLDAGKRRVELADNEVLSRLLWVYERAEERPLLLRAGEPEAVSMRGYDAAREIDFVVRVPSEWRGDREKQSRLVALVNGNKLASKRYRVEYIN